MSITIDKKTFNAILLNYKDDEDRWYFIKSQYIMLEPYFTKTDVFEMLTFIKSSHNQNKMIKFFMLWFTTYQDMISVVDMRENDYDKQKTIKLFLKQIKEPITVDQVFELANKMSTSYEKFELIKYFKKWISTLEHIERIIKFVEDDSEKMKIIKEFYKVIDNFSKSDLYILMKYIKSNYYKKELIKFFKASFSWEDITYLVDFMDSNDEKIWIIKLLYNSKKDINMKIDDVLQLVPKMVNDNGRINLLNFFRNWITPDYFVLALSHMQKPNKIIKLVKEFEEFGKGLDACIFLDFIPEDNEYERLRLLKILRTNNINTEILKRFKSDNGKLKALKIRHYPNIYDTKILRTYVELFSQDISKYMFLKNICLKNSIDKYAHTLLDLVVDEQYREKIAKCLVENNSVKSTECLVKIFAFLKPSARYHVLVKYTQCHKIKNLSLVLKKLKSIKYAAAFIKKNNDLDLNKTLKYAGYNLKDYEANDQLLDDIDDIDDIDDDSFSDDDDMDPQWIPDENGIIKVDLNEINIPHREYFDMIYPDGIIQYNILTDKIMNNFSFDSSVTVNGVNIFAQIKNTIKYEIKKKQDKINKINKLRVPHKWNDVKLQQDDDEGDGCVVCLTRKRQIIFSCGHYHTCSKCSRNILKGNKECPMCRKSIDNVTRVFA